MKKPEDLFRAEKERALTVRNSQHARLLAEAKAAFDKLMAEGQAARKSGRPRKHPLPPLKTSSSTRPPMKPAAAPAPTPAPLMAKSAPAKPAEPVKAAKPAAKPVAKVAPKAAAPAKKSVKAASSKTKVKLKRPTKR
jgi:hypothetical protein